MTKSVNIATAMGGGALAPSGERSIEVITGEVLELKKVAGTAIIDIGHRLAEAKAMLSHGEWLPWLTERVEFSERTAQSWMRLSREWTNPQALADLGATKALALLALDGEERESFIQQDGVADMSVRELEQAVRAQKDALLAKEQAEADKRVAEQSRDKMADDMAMLKAQLEELQARPIEVTGISLPDAAALEDAKKEAVQDMEAKLDKMRTAKEKAEEKAKQAQADLEGAQAKLAHAAKQDKVAAIAADKDMATFEVLFTQGQDLANRMGGILLKLRNREEPEKAEGVKRAMLALADMIRGAAE